MCSNSAHTDCAKQASKSGQLRKKFALQFVLLVAVVLVGAIVCICVEVEETDSHVKLRACLIHS